METIKQLTPELIATRSSGMVSCYPDEFKGSPSERIEKAIAQAVKSGINRVTIQGAFPGREDGKWFIDRAIIVPSRFSLILDGCWIELAPGVRDNIIRNEAAGRDGAEPDRMIEVLGVSYPKAVLCGGESCHFDIPGDKSGWRTIGLLLHKVEGFILSDFEMRNTQSWAISMENGCSTGEVSNIHFENLNTIPNQDGVNVRKGCHDILISDITGSLGDDVVALTGLRCAKGQQDKTRPSMQIGGNEENHDDDIYNITIRNVYAKCVGGHGIIRILNNDGIKIHDVKIENVWNTASPSDKPVYSTVRIGDKNPRYASIRLGNGDEVYNITVDGVYWSGQSGIRNEYEGHQGLVARNVVPLSECRPRASLVPMPKKLKWTDAYFFAPSPYVSREWITFVHDESFGEEAYALSVTPEKVTVRASSVAGERYAMVTLRQLSGEKSRHRNIWPYTGGDAGAPLKVPCCEIEDSPELRWRGVLLDEGRHFFGKETVKHLLDQMFYHKLNVFHWHLTEDQGWRIKLDSYPLLTEYGAVRPESVTHFPYSGHQFNGEKYGPYFYTKDDIREIVAYAAERNITIVPEIEFPGHIRAALAAYPEFSCKGEGLPRVPRCSWGIEEDVLCVGNEDAMKFIEDVIDEVTELFPGKFFHFGGDECPTTRWCSCEKCQAKAKELGIQVEKLQGYVTTRFSKYLETKGKRVIGWDEILECQVPDSTAGMRWRGNFNPERIGSHEFVNCPQPFCYLNRTDGNPEDPYCPRDGREFIDLKKVYSLDPLAGIAPEFHKNLLGTQACLWSEVIWNRYDMDWRLWPRGAALAEVAWTGHDRGSFEDFAERLSEHRLRLIQQGVNCAPIYVKA